MRVFLSRTGSSLLVALSVSVAAEVRAEVEGGDPVHSLARLHVEWSSRAEAWMDGYRYPVGGETIGYHSPIPGVSSALLTRATDGSMAIAWETAPVPTGFDGETATFIWLAGVDERPDGESFDVAVDGVPKFVLRTSGEEEWQVSSRDGSRLSFRSVMSDEWGDFFGYMVLELPAADVRPGHPVTVTVTGRAEGSMAWFMVFKHPEVVRPFRESRDGGFWYRLRWREGQDIFGLEMPAVWAGRSVTLTGGARLARAGRLELREDHSEAVWHESGGQAASLALPATISVDGVLVDRLDSLGGSWTATDAFDDGLLVKRSKWVSGEEDVLEASGNFAFALASGIGRITDSYFRGGGISLITSSHQDIAWMDSPQSCIIQRDTLVLSPALDLLARDPEFRYSAEQALMLKEYLGRHPDRLPEIAALSKSGRLEWGATYNQPYEGMYSGESLARQLYFGRRWLMNTLPGYDPRTAWNVDVPSRSLQMAQILKKAGVDYLVMSRFRQGLYWWESPDGSRVGAYSPGHYHVDSDFMRQGSLPEIAAAYPAVVDAWEPLYVERRLEPILPVLVSSDMSAPRDYSELVRQWNSFELRSRDTGARHAADLPPLRYGTMQGLLDELYGSDPSLPVITGERPNVWLYIHGPSHHRAITASRDAARLLTAAETFSSVAAVLRGDLDKYPVGGLEDAWEAQIYPDHGWGGKNGHITDNLFLARSEFARSEAEHILSEALEYISGRVLPDSSSDRTIVVFNDLSWKRDDPASVRLSFGPGEAVDVAVTDGRGRPVPAGLHDTVRYESGTIRHATVSFVARDVPPIGYATFSVSAIGPEAGLSVVPRMDEAISDAEAGPGAPGRPTLCENDFYRIELAPGGIRQIHDKELGRDLFITDKFLAGEVFTMRSEGNGAGEFAAVQQPTMDGFNQMRLYPATWRLAHDSPVATSFELEQQWPDVRVRQTLTVYHAIKRVDVSVDLLDWQGTEYREFRLAWPLDMEQAEIAYEVPFGVVTIGKSEMSGAAGERYVQNAADIRPREVMDWFGASDDSWGFTMSSDVAVFDYVDPTAQPAGYPVLQPVLLASRKSCHWEGNWYLQPGDHHYRFSFTSHRPGWPNGYRLGARATHPLRPSEVHAASTRRDLPSGMSFASVSHPNVVLGTIKRAEDGKGLVVRAVEMEGRDVTVGVDWFTPVQTAMHTNLIEEEIGLLDIGDGGVELEMGHNAIETFRMDVAPWAEQ